MVNPNNSFVVQSSPVMDKQAIHDVAVRDIRCQTQYVSVANAPSNVTIRIQVLDG